MQMREWPENSKCRPMAVTVVRILPPHQGVGEALRQSFTPDLAQIPADMKKLLAMLR